MLAAWVLTTPFAVMGLVSSSAALNRALARMHWLMLPLGWIALFTVIVNVVFLGEARSELALWIAAPLAGLSIWVRGRGDDGGEDPPPEPEPDGGPGDTLPCTRRTRPPIPSTRPRGHGAPKRVPSHTF